MIGVFDKDPDGSTFTLRGRAESTKLETFEDLEAALNSECDCLFVHVKPEGWATLCEKLPDNRIALRFSTSNRYPRSLPDGRHGNCFRCLKPTTQEPMLSSKEFDALVSVFSNPEIASQVRTAIPQKIRGLVALSSAHHLRALHILLQACMVQWGKDKEHGGEAINILGCQPEPASLQTVPNRAGTFYRLLTGHVWSKPPTSDREEREKLRAPVAKQLQDELGVANFGEDNPLENLLTAVFDAENEGDPLEWQTTKEAFRVLESVLRTLGHGSHDQ